MEAPASPAALRIDAEDVRPLGGMRHVDSPSAGECSGNLSRTLAAEREPSDSSAECSSGSAAHHAGLTATGTAFLLLQLQTPPFVLAMQYEEFCVHVPSAICKRSLVSCKHEQSRRLLTGWTAAGTCLRRLCSIAPCWASSSAACLILSAPVWCRRKAAVAASLVSRAT